MIYRENVNEKACIERAGFFVFAEGSVVYFTLFQIS